MCAYYAVVVRSEFGRGLPVSCEIFSNYDTRARSVVVIVDVGQLVFVEWTFSVFRRA